MDVDVTEMEPENFSDDDVPSADPAIRLAYEAALGRFILAFSEVEFRVNKLIIGECGKAGQSPDKLIKSDFSRRLIALKRLRGSAAKGVIDKVPFKKMTNLSVDRNVLAHGHFDQNPFQGDYSVIARQRDRDYPVTKIDRLTAILSEVIQDLRFVEATYEFSAVALP